MGKPPKRAPTANKPKPAATHRLTGSAALIAAMQAEIPDTLTLTKATLSCAAPIAVEFFLVFYGYAVRRFLAYLDHREVHSAKRQAERDQAEKLRLAEQKLDDALRDPNLEEAEKIKLKIAFATGKRVLAEKAMHTVFEIYTPSDESANSVQQVQGGSMR